MSPPHRRRAARSLAALLLALLPACRSVAEFGPRTTTLPADGARLPARWSRGVVLLHVDLPGRRDSQLMLLDTGTDRTLLDLRTAHELGLSIEGDEAVVTATGTSVAASRLQRLPWLRIGAARFEQVDAVGIDLTALREHGGLPIVGIAGCDLFRQCLLELDYEARIVRLQPRDRAPTAGGHAFVERCPWIDLTVAGTTMRALVDSGFQQSLALPPGTTLPWLRRPRNDGEIAAIDGVAARQVARLDGDVVIGELEWRNPSIVLVPGSPKVGAGLLHRCILRLDAAGGRIWIEPGQSVRSR